MSLRARLAQYAPLVVAALLGVGAGLVVDAGRAAVRAAEISAAVASRDARRLDECIAIAARANETSARLAGRLVQVRDAIEHLPACRDDVECPPIVPNSDADQCRANDVPATK